MKKNFKKILLYIIIISTCSICNFTYATEDDGRFVDIPVPPSSTGRTDFTSEEAEEQTKEYEQNENNNQSKDEGTENLYNEKENKDTYMIALRDEQGELIGYYEKHEYRNRETEPVYNFQ